jgi:hypothetical protein
MSDRSKGCCRTVAMGIQWYKVKPHWKKGVNLLDQILAVYQFNIN